MNLHHWEEGAQARAQTGGRPRQQKGIAKVLQSEFAIGLVLVADGRRFFFWGELPCSLQVVQRKTSECFKSALESQTRVQFVAELRPHFRLAVDLATTDQDASNIRLQRHFVATSPSVKRTTCRHRRGAR